MYRIRYFEGFGVGAVPNELRSSFNMVWPWFHPPASAGGGGRFVKQS